MPGKTDGRTDQFAQQRHRERGRGPAVDARHTVDYDWVCVGQELQCLAVLGLSACNPRGIVGLVAEAVWLSGLSDHFFTKEK